MDFANVTLIFGFEMLIELTKNGALAYRFKSIISPPSLLTHDDWLYYELNHFGTGFLPKSNTQGACSAPKREARRCCQGRRLKRADSKFAALRSKVCCNSRDSNYLRSSPEWKTETNPQDRRPFVLLSVARYFDYGAPVNGTP